MPLKSSQQFGQRTRIFSVPAAVHQHPKRATLEPLTITTTVTDYIPLPTCTVVSDVHSD